MTSPDRTKRHRRRKWFWYVIGAVGLVDYAIRGDITQLWEQPIADSVPVLFFISAIALAIGESGAEEAAPGRGKMSGVAIKELWEKFGGRGD